MTGFLVEVQLFPGLKPKMNFFEDIILYSQQHPQQHSYNKYECHMVISVNVILLQAGGMLSRHNSLEVTEGWGEAGFGI